MATQVQYRRGTATENNAYTGALAEITVDTTNGTLRVHNGITAGGSNVATVSYVTAQLASLSSNSISFGTSNVRVSSSGGNVVTSVGGTANVLNVTSTGAIVTGDLTVTGNATLSGNILGDRIQNGTTQIDIQTASGNANITVGGVSNVAVFSTAGAYITGTLGVTGNISGANLTGAHFGSGAGLTGIPNGSLSNSSVTVNGVAISLGGSATITATATNALTIGTGLGGTSYNGSGAVTITNTGVLSLANGGGITASSSTGAITLGSTATSANTASAIVARDASGNFSAGTITATLTGAATTAGTVTTAAQPNITSVGTLVSVAVTGAITGGSLSVSAGNITGGNLILSGALEDSGQLDIRTTASNGNIVLTPNGTGVIVAGRDIVNGQANGVGNIGSATTYFNTVFAKATSAQYADLAEMYVSDSMYAPGTVVEFGGDKEVTISSTSHSTAVAGIVSTNPSYLMNSTQTGEYVLPVALTGRVPCQVLGPVRKGDVLVASSTPGVAQRIGINWQPGCVVGKAMEVINTVEIKTIEVAVGRL